MVSRQQSLTDVYGHHMFLLLFTCSQSGSRTFSYKQEVCDKLISNNNNIEKH